MITSFFNEIEKVYLASIYFCFFTGPHCIVVNKLGLGYIYSNVGEKKSRL